MGRIKIQSVVLVFIFICLLAVSSQAQTKPKIGIRAGIGTDINLGLAYGAGGNMLFELPQNSLELGIVIFGGSSEETSDNGYNEYIETTDVFVFGILGNYLFGYTPKQPGMFYVAGVGFASISAEWEEKSKTDGSLGSPYPESGYPDGSMHSDDGSAAGTVLNLGAGYSFASGFDIRAEFPTIISFAPPGESAGVIPTLIVTGGMRF